MTENLRNLCTQLRLAYVADSFENVEFSFPQDFLSKVFTQEIEMRDLAKVERNLKKARIFRKQDPRNLQMEFLNSLAANGKQRTT